MIFVHVGYPKAASSTIQRFLAANAAALAPHGVIYPVLFETREEAYGLGPATHNPLAIELKRGAPAAAWQRLRAIVAGAPAANVLLSGEKFTSCDPQSLCDALGDQQIRIIAYVRELPKIIVSLYAQLTKTGANTEDFDAFFERKVDRAYLSLADHFAAWARVFGAENIRVRLLDRRTLSGGDVRIDVLDAAGLDGAALVRELEMTPDVNTAPGWKTLEILRDINRTLSDRLVATESRAALKAAKMARRRRTGSPLLDFTATMAQPAEVLGRKLGFDDRGKYLTERQFAHCAEQFDVQIDALEKMGMDTRLAHAARGDFTPREFLPAIDRIPPKDVAEFLRRLAPAGWWNLISGAEKAASPNPVDDSPPDLEEAEA